MDVHCLIFDCDFLKVFGVAESALRRDKVLLYAKDFDNLFPSCHSLNGCALFDC